jgi:hypothetical protein
MTDEETLQGAKMMLHHELERAVSDYLDHWGLDIFVY